MHHKQSVEKLATTLFEMNIKDSIKKSFWGRVKSDSGRNLVAVSLCASLHALEDIFMIGDPFWTEVAEASMPRLLTILQGKTKKEDYDAIIGLFELHKELMLQKTHAGIGLESIIESVVKQGNELNKDSERYSNDMLRKWYATKYLNVVNLYESILKLS